jgi:E3 ubiquitin-protein ligase SHPRH
VQLDAACCTPSEELVRRAGDCGRCRAELGVRGQLCEHCGLDELFLRWELRLFRLTTRALQAGNKVGGGEEGRRE